MAGSSGTLLPKQLGIKDASRFAVRRAPDGFADTPGELPRGAKWRARVRPGLGVVIAFATR
jgi:hypothetical protein